MGKKYKVQQGNQFLGHYSAHSAEEAIAKAIEKQSEFYSIDPNAPFDIKYGLNWQTVTIGGDL